MKRSFVLLFIWALFVSVGAQDFKTVRDGVEYAEIVRTASPEPLRINLLRLDLKKVRLDVAHALDAAVGLEKTSSIAARHGAFAAVNAGFFRLDTSIFAGDAAGILKIDGKIWSESINDRIALLIVNGKNQTDVFFDHLRLTSELSVGKSKFALSGINRQRNKDEIILYGPEFGRTTLTEPNGLEIVVKNNLVTQVIDGKGSSQIPQNGYIISAVGNSRELLLKAKIKSGQKVSVSTTNINFQGGNNFSYERFNNFQKAEDIVGGVPQLIRNGRLEITWEQERASKSFVETRHPRTAVARLEDGKFLLLTVDGRQPDASVGMSLPELAEFLLKLGAVDAMNLDGGGSTTMVLDGRLVNRPSDKEGERRVSDALLVFPRSK